MASRAFANRRPLKPHLLENSDVGGEVKHLRAQLDEAFTELETYLDLAPLISQEFTNAPATDDDYFLTSHAAAATQDVVNSGFAATSIASGARNVIITRSAAAGKYVTDDITVHGTLNGEAVTLTFTPGDADGGDVIEANETTGIDTILSVTFPGQVDTSGAFKVGFGVKFALNEAVKARAGLTAPIRQVYDGSVVTNGTFSGHLYTPNTAPNGTHDYAVIYEADV